MAFPSTPILDNFDRADVGPPPSASWYTPAGRPGLRVVSNHCEIASIPDDYGVGGWNTQFGPDVELYCDYIAGTSNVSAIQLYIRFSTPGFFFDLGNGYILIATMGTLAGGGGLQLTRCDAGVFTPLDTIAMDVTAGDSVGISAIGTTIKAYHKPSAGSWTQKLSVTDATYNASGYVGVQETYGVDKIDNFGGGSLGRTGDLSQTLGALSLSADGWLERIGDLAQTLGALTLDAQGEALTYQYPILINVQRITASGPGAIGVVVSGHAISQNVRADSLVVENGGILEARGVYYDTITTLGTGQIIPLRSDRGAWDVGNYAGRHASDIDASTWVYHRNPALSGSYVVTDPSVRRILDVASTSLNEVAAILGTLIGDLGLT